MLAMGISPPQGNGFFWTRAFERSMRYLAELRHDPDGEKWRAHTVEVAAGWLEEWMPEGAEVKPAVVEGVETPPAAVGISADDLLITFYEIARTAEL